MTIIYSMKYDVTKQSPNSQQDRTDLGLSWD